MVDTLSHLSIYLISLVFFFFSFNILHFNLLITVLFFSSSFQPTNLETRDGRHSSESSHRLEDH